MNRRRGGIHAATAGVTTGEWGADETTYVQSPTIWQIRAGGSNLVMLHTLDQRI